MSRTLTQSFSISLTQLHQRLPPPNTPAQNKACRTCGGACCKRAPGYTHPAQWATREEWRRTAYRLLRTSQKGLKAQRDVIIRGDPVIIKIHRHIMGLKGIKRAVYTLDSWDYDPLWPHDVAPWVRSNLYRPDRIYGIRARGIRDDPSLPYNAAWGQSCASLGLGGCTISTEDRPFECRGLVSNTDEPGNCRPTDDAERWTSKPSMYRYGWANPVVQATLMGVLEREEMWQQAKEFLG